MSKALDLIKQVTSGTDYQGRLFLVGGAVRDKVLGLPVGEDIDIVIEGNSAELAHFLFREGITEHKPVVYPRFGTAMVTINGRHVELVSARSESYVSESRKPDVVPATLEDDVLRRDFTINTLLENIHTGEVLDLTGRGLEDIHRGIIRTPTDPEVTFEDDPLRMLRAVRFAARFGFQIDEETYSAIIEKAHRLSIISKERIREEFSKMLMTKSRAQAMEMLRSTGLLAQFAPELQDMEGVTQNVYHLYDVWVHTLKTLEALPEDSDLTLRLAALFHDIGKPATRSIDDEGRVHFYTHHLVGAKITAKVLTRLRYPNELTVKVVKLVSMHLRTGEYSKEWTDSAVRRLVRDAGQEFDDLVELTRADAAASNTAFPSADLDDLLRRVKAIEQEIDICHITSPLDGQQIMELLDTPPGPIIGKVKDFLENEVIEGRLRPKDEDHARKLVLERWGRKSSD